MKYIEDNRYRVEILDDIIHFVFHDDYVEERGCDDIKFSDAHAAHVFGMFLWDALTKDKERHSWVLTDSIDDQLPMFELWRWTDKIYSLDDYQCNDGRMHSVTLSDVDRVKIADALFRASVDLRVKEWAK